MIIMTGSKHYTDSVINVIIYMLLLSSLAISGCQKRERIVGNTCNGKIVRGPEKNSECYILRARWSNKDIDNNDILNITHTLESKIREIKKGIGKYAEMDNNEKNLLISEIKGELSIYQRNDWKSFIGLYKKGDKFFSYKSVKGVTGLGSGIIIVRNYKVIGSYETLTE